MAVRRVKETKRVYDPKTQKWHKVESYKSVKDKTSSTSEKKDGKKADKESSKKSTKGKTQKKAKKKTLRSLTGTINYVPDENTIKMKPRDTIQLSGLGKYLSGKYYVESVERSLSSSGYSQSASVIKTNFRKTIKIKAKYPNEKAKLKAFNSAYKQNLEKYKKTHKGASPKSHTVKKRETLYTISKKYFGSTSYASKLAKINGNMKKSKWTKLPVGYKLVIARK